MKSRALLIETGIALLVLLFFYAGVIKFLHYSSFAADMHNQVFPGWLKTVAIYALPAIETLIACSLITERTRRAGLWAALCVLLVFTIYAVGALLNWFSRMPCSCGGIINILTWPEHLVFNGFFLAVNIATISFYKKQVAVNKQTQSSNNKRIHA